MEVITEPILELVLRTILLAPLAILILVVYVRLFGLRSFSKMTSYDFVATVAIGSLLANAAVATSWSSYIQSVGAIGTLMLVQYLLSKGRRCSPTFRSLISNQPVVLFENGEFNQSAMENCSVTETDVWAKLREANALQIDCVHAVVLETTGDIAVLHGGDLDDKILTGVKEVD